MEIMRPEDCVMHVIGKSRCVCKFLCMSESAPSSEKNRAARRQKIRVRTGWHLRF